MTERALTSYLLDSLNREHSTDYTTLGDYLKGPEMEADPASVLKLLASVKILDPSCGCGNFLESMLGSLVSTYRMVFSRTDTGAVPKDLEYLLDDRSMAKHIVEKNLYGIDISQGAVNVARARLAMHLLDGGDTCRLEGVRLNIYAGDALIGPSFLDPPIPGKIEAPGRSSMEWAGDPSLPGGGFDIIIGNPPYGKLKNMDIPLEKKRELSALYKSLYRMTGSNIDLYKLFLERCLGLVGPRGVISLVIPTNFWGDMESAELRRALFENGLCYVAIFPLEMTRSLFGGKINYEVSAFLASASGPARDGTEIMVGPNCLMDAPSYRLGRRDVHEGSKLYRVPTFKDPHVEMEIFKRLSRHGKLADLGGGKKVHIFVGKLDESLGRMHITDRPTGDLLIASNHIKDWYLDTVPRTERKRWVRDRGVIARRPLRKRLMGARTVGELMALGPKIIGRQMANRGERRKLHFTMHFDDHILTNGVRTILVDDADKRVHRTLLAFLNSDLLNWYFSLYSHTYNVKPYELFELPFPSLDETALDHFSRLSDLMLFSMAISRYGDKGMGDAFSLFDSVLNASVDDLMLFDNRYGVIGRSLRHLCPVDFEEWSGLHMRSLIGGTNVKDERLRDLEEGLRRSVLRSIVSLQGDDALSAAMEGVGSEGWTVAIRGTACPGPKRF